MQHTNPSPALPATSSMSRRGFLQFGALAMGTIVAPSLSFAHHSSSSKAAERTLALYNMHTGEKLKRVYWAKGHYVPEALAEINVLLRDHRQDQKTFMDPDLLDFLYTVSRKVKARQPLHIISGYRSPNTNAKLRKRGRGVAKESQHMYGKAVDFYVPGRELATVRQAALSLRRGGVGYYSRSNFLHIDTARFRSWGS